LGVVQRHLAAVIQADLQRPGQPGLGDLGVHDPPDARLVDRALDLQVLFNRPGQTLEDFGVLPVALALHDCCAVLFASHKRPRFPVGCVPEPVFADPVSVIPILM
jgi:hypothetical protein